MTFGGSTYSAELDEARLTSLFHRVKTLMLDGQWRTYAEIQTIVGNSEGGIGARLRDLRKPKFGSYIVEGRRRGDPKRGLYEYRLREPEKQPRLFE